MASQQMQQRRRVAPLLAFVVLMILVDGVSAWSSNQKAFRSPKQMGHSKKPSQKLTQQKMLKNPGNPRVRDTSKGSPSGLSHSVLASCDTLPRFPTAHGLLSPETVERIEDLTASGRGSDALVGFVQQYRQKGPLSCLSMLSDPEVLPFLTQAMRDVAE